MPAKDKRHRNLVECTGASAHQARRSKTHNRPGLAAWYKNFVSKRRPVSKSRRETTSGGIVFRRNKGHQQLEILLIQDAKNRWTIPKGTSKK